MNSAGLSGERQMLEEPDPSKGSDGKPTAPARHRGVLPQTAREELLVIAAFAGFALWLFWWL
jgi:hypothetical protein